MRRSTNGKRDATVSPLRIDTTPKLIPDSHQCGGCAERNAQIREAQRGGPCRVRDRLRRRPSRCRSGADYVHNLGVNELLNESLMKASDGKGLQIKDIRRRRLRVCNGLSSSSLRPGRQIEDHGRNSENAAACTIGSKEQPRQDVTVNVVPVGPGAPPAGRAWPSGGAAHFQKLSTTEASKAAASRSLRSANT